MLSTEYFLLSFPTSACLPIYIFIHFVTQSIFCNLYVVSANESKNYMDVGLQLLGKGQIVEALNQFHSAVESNPNDYLAFYRRATTYLALGSGRSALHDLDTVLSLRPDFAAARQQRANIYLKQGLFDLASSDLDIVLEKLPSDESLAKRELITQLAPLASEAIELVEHDQSFKEALPLLSQVLEHCPWSVRLRELRASSYVATGYKSQAIYDIKAITRLTNDNTAAFYQISLLYYDIGDEEQSLNEIRECLKLDPDHKTCFSHYKKVKKLAKQLSDGESLMSQGDYMSALEKYETVIAANHGNSFASKILPLKCKCYSKDQKTLEAIKVCSDAISEAENQAELYALRAEAYLLNEEFHEAISDYQKAVEIEGDNRNYKDGLAKANKLLKQSERRDYYKILGVKRTAGKKAIEKAYRKLAQKWHPDSYDGEEKAHAEKMFMDIAAAKEVLIDKEKRAAFDRGEDPLDPEQQRHGGGGHPFHGGFPFPFGGGGEHTHFTFHFG